MRTAEDLVPHAPFRGATLFTRQEPLAAYLAATEYVSSSMLRRFARGEAHTATGYADDGRSRLPQALHSVMLEPGRFEQDYFVLDADLTIHAYGDKSDLLDRIWLSSAEHAGLRAMQESIRSYTRAPLAEWLDSGVRELSIYFTDEAGGRWKARPDCFTESLILELKTTQDVRPAAFARTRRRFGYDLQAAHYVDAVRRLTGRTARFAYIAVEPRAPYYVWLHELAADDLERAADALAEVRQDYVERIAAAR
jgi:exodeoxyribonuclease VIII